ncbi:hypothetical protein [Azospirillum griseum]|uniref:Uncharacterized protein n=1 Tax=Azospirillum griseum TaxID=2496639 RepID=A0A3S0KYG1_9PROT|nr:hypothetical protein [Azospirillum griseum]RTR20247.1 hypothetical protein EJ903_11980 [Azospirillum griseum]
MEIKDLIALGDKLLYIDEAKFRQIVELLEQMGDHPDIQRTIAVIRPRMVELRIHRRPTMKRLFCDPFEDLFEVLEQGAPLPLSVIERALMNSLWPVVEAKMGRAKLKGYHGALQDGPQRDNIADAFWTEAAEVVAALSANSEAGRFEEGMDLRLNPDRVRAIADIATILSIAPEIRDLKTVLSPKPVTKLHKDHIDGVRDLGRKVARTRPDALKIFVLVAASRLSNPSVLLGGLHDMDFGQKPAERSKLLMELTDTVVGQIEDRSRSLRATPDGVPDRLAVADLAVDLVASLDATRNAVELTRNKAFDQRLKEVRNSIHDMVKTQVIADADNGIVTAVAGLTGGTNDKPQLLAAENQARALRKCATIADSLGLRGELKTVTQKATGSLTDQARKALAAGPTGSTSRAGFTAIRMIELLSGPAEANKLMDEILSKGPR